MNSSIKKRSMEEAQLLNEMGDGLDDNDVVEHKKKDKKKKDKKKSDKSSTAKKSSKKKKSESDGSKKKKRKLSDVNDEVTTENIVNGKTNGEVKKNKKQKKETAKEDDTAPGPPVENFRITQETIKILKEKGYTHLFPIQAMTYDHIYDGKDVIGRAITGSGKTLSFALPVIERIINSNNEVSSSSSSTMALGRKPKVLCLSPTRELSKQIAKEFDAIGRTLTTICIYGGAPYGPQINVLRRGVDIVVGTPGRVIDHIEKGTLDLSQVQYVILDEADEMLNIGFQDDVDEILKHAPTPDKRQTLLFSATIPPWVANIAKQHMRVDNQIRVDLVGQNQVKPKIRHLAVCCSTQVRQATLADVVRVYAGPGGRTIVFANTKNEANELALSSSLRQICQVLHGDIIQSQREITLQGFRDGRFTCLVATDVAARGLDIPEVDLVVQCQPPRDPETYIHRSGRTARAGRSGTCITFFTKSEKASGVFTRLERAIGSTFELIGTPQPADLVRVAAKNAELSLKVVHGDMKEFFTPSAKRLIEQYGPVEAMAMALATICGYTQPIKSRSLLTSEQGLTTILITTPRRLFTPMQVITLIKQRLGADCERKIRDIRLCEKEGMAIADLPEELVKELVALTEEDLRKNGVPLDSNDDDDDENDDDENDDDDEQQSHAKRFSITTFEVAEKLPKLKDQLDGDNRGPRGGGGGGRNRNGNSYFEKRGDRRWGGGGGGGDQRGGGGGRRWGGGGGGGGGDRRGGSGGGFNRRSFGGGRGRSFGGGNRGDRGF